MNRTVTYDPEQWQLVPVRPSDAMIAGMETLDWTDSDVRANCFNMWQTALAAAPQHESQWQPDTIKIPRPEGHDSWSIEIKTSYGGGGGVGAKVGNYVGGGGGGSYPDTGETTSPSVADLP